MFRRGKADKRPTSGGAGTDGPGPEPTPPGGHAAPDESVLDELSRAFGAPRADVVDDDTVPADAEPLIMTGDDAVEAAPPVRTTITIGGDEVDSGFVDAVSLDEALGRPGNLSAEATAAPRERARGRSTISIGGDDSLPDAVYLDEADVELDGGESDGTVFIDDDGTGDAIAPKDAAAQGIEPRIRQRRIGVRRAASRKRLKWVVLGLFVLLLLLGVLTVLGSGLFTIEEVSVGGDVYTDQERLEAVIDELMGTPVLLADTEQAEADLEAIPWVEDARVRTKFPNSATIEIRERSPVATMRGADGLFRVLDDDGRVLDVIEGQPVAYVLIAGPGTLDLAAGEFAPIGQSSAASLVTKLTPTIRPRVESIEVTDDGSDLILNLAPAPDSEQTSTIRVRFGSAIGDNEQIEKLVRLENKLDDLPDGIVSEINVATDEVTVR